MNNLTDRGTLRGRVKISNIIDYVTNVINKPAINGHTLEGNKTGHDLGLANADEIKNIEVTPSYNSGKKIAQIDVSGETNNIYIPYMRGATATLGGEGGIVPTPQIGDKDKYLRGDGTWTEIESEPTSERIPITAGDGSNSRTFIFDRIPKKISMQYVANGWGMYRDVIWGADRSYYQGSQATTSDSATYVGVSAITCDDSTKSMTISGLNAIQAANTTDIVGYMYIEY